MKMACPICGETRVADVQDGHDVYACGFSSDGSTVQSQCRAGRTTCTCAIHDLMTGGCRCGAFEKEQAAKTGGGQTAGAGSGSSNSGSDSDAGNSV
jgi:hypothetical protein